jgi:hypothetical protein
VLRIFTSGAGCGGHHDEAQHAIERGRHRHVGAIEERGRVEHHLNSTATTGRAIDAKTTAKPEVRISSSRSHRGDKITEEAVSARPPHYRLSAVENLTDRPGQTPQTMHQFSPPNAQISSRIGMGTPNSQSNT